MTQQIRGATQIKNLNFLNLDDTPSSYSGQAYLIPRVKGTEDGLEFVTVSGSGGGSFLTLTDTPSVYTSQGKRVLYVNSGATAVAFAPNLYYDDSTDYVGIGVSSPSQIFHVYKSLDGNVIGLIENPNAGTGNVSRWKALADVHYIEALVFGSGTGSSEDAWIRTDANYLRLYADAAHIMSLDGVNSRVGIGIVSPTETLHVYGTGTVYCKFETDTNNAVGFKIKNSGDSGQWFFYEDTSQNFIISRGGSAFFQADTGGDWYTDGFTDISGTSTITGWSSLTTTQLWYKKLGDLVFVKFRLIGTSDSTSTSFTVPYQADSAGGGWVFTFRSTDNGSTAIGNGLLGQGNTTVNLYPGTTSGGSWTASGSKNAEGMMFYQST